MRNIIIAASIGIVIVIGGYVFLQSANQSGQTQIPNTTTQTVTSSATKPVPGYQGKVLAGSAAPFLEFSKVDYDKALAEGKIILLDFYANWCPICRSEAPMLHTGFDGLTTDQVIGFRVNYNDSDTDEAEKALARQFNITYQHTKVILKNGQQFSKSLDSWTKEDFDKEISKAL